MSLFEARVRSIETGDIDRRGIVSVHGALVQVRFDLLPTAAVGDLCLIDSGVAVALLTTAAPSTHRPKDA